jgi:DNA polymerase III delta prime subunit
MDWQVTGHQNQIKLLEKALAKGKLAHAYVFAGPEGVGKKLVAKSLAKEMLSENAPSLALRAISPRGGEKSESYFHPDFLEVASENGIKIEQIRELAYKLSLKPYQAKYKVALIDNADQMTIEAANALLKVLEEPKAYNFIFLITSNANRLPKTILSRCQKINFAPSKQEASTMEDEGRELLDVFIRGKMIDRLIAAYDLADMEPAEIKKILDSWMKELEIRLLDQPTKNLVQKISWLTASRKYLDQNVNSKLLLTNLMLNT